MNDSTTNETSELEAEESKSKAHRTIAGPDGDPIPITKDIRITLGIEKFTRPRKHYRLIWVVGRMAWPYEEIPVEFRRKQDATAIGAELARLLGVNFVEVTR